MDVEHVKQNSATAQGIDMQYHLSHIVSACSTAHVVSDSKQAVDKMDLLNYASGKNKIIKMYVTTIINMLTREILHLTI